MKFKHFCHICNVNFHRAVDFITHQHKEVEPLINIFINDKEEDGRTKETNN